MLDLDITCMLSVLTLKLYYSDSIENELFWLRNIYRKIRTGQNTNGVLLSCNLSKSRLCRL